MCKTCRNRFKRKSPFIKAIKKDPDGKRHTIGFEPKKKGYTAFDTQAKD